MKIITRFALIMGLLTITGCGDLDLAAWVGNMQKLKTAAIQESANRPYREKQFTELKAYFYEIEQISLALKNDPEFSALFIDALQKSDLQQVCKDTLIEQSQWESMISGCWKNRYFLCSEDVRSYPDNVRAIRENLSNEVQNRFDQTKECVAAYQATFWPI